MREIDQKICAKPKPRVLGFGFVSRTLIGGIVKDAGNIPAAEIIARADAWKFGDRIHLFVELCGFIFSIVALRVWSAESEITGETNG